MQKLLLTSAGLTDSMKEIFYEHIPKPVENIKVIYVPSAATVNDSAREGIVIGMAELIKMGIAEKNITIYNLNYLLSKEYQKTYSAYVDYNSLPVTVKLMSSAELLKYDVIVFCGGFTEVLLDEINRTGFNTPLIDAVKSSLFYIGVSAGSMIAANNLPDNLGFIQNSIIPHCEIGTPLGNVSQDIEIHLTDNQAVWIYGNSVTIIS